LRGMTASAMVRRALRGEKRSVRRVGYAIGLLFLFLAAASLVAQILSVIAHGGYRLISLASICEALGAQSLSGLQTAVESQVSAALWPPLAWLLALPAWLLLGLVGALLFFTGRGSARARGGFD
jgi:hypothetical protein